MSQRAAVLNRGSTTQTQPPTQEDQIRGYQQIQRLQYNTRRNLQRRFGARYIRTLESMVSPERQLELSRDRRASLVPAEVLYSSNRTTANHRVYQHYSERRIRVTDGQQENINICNSQSYRQLQESGLQHVHIGLLMIRVHALHRRGAGTMALAVFRDTRWDNSTSIIGTMEIEIGRAHV